MEMKRATKVVRCGIEYERTMHYTVCIKETLAVQLAFALLQGFVPFRCSIVVHFVLFTCVFSM